MLSLFIHSFHGSSWYSCRRSTQCCHDAQRRGAQCCSELPNIVAILTSQCSVAVLNVTVINDAVNIPIYRRGVQCSNVVPVPNAPMSSWCSMLWCPTPRYQCPAVNVPMSLRCSTSKYHSGAQLHNKYNMFKGIVR